MYAWSDHAGTVSDRVKGGKAYWLAQKESHYQVVYRAPDSSMKPLTGNQIGPQEMLSLEDLTTKV